MGFQAGFEAATTGGVGSSLSLVFSSSFLLRTLTASLLVLILAGLLLRLGFSKLPAIPNRSCPTKAQLKLEFYLIP